MFESTIKSVTWQDVADRVKSVNPELYQIISELDPSPKYRLYIGEYPYGCQILKQGKFQIPVKEGGMVPIEDSKVPRRLQEDLGYNLGSNPVFLILENSIELFLDDVSQKNEIFSLTTATTGSMFGTSQVVSDVAQQPCYRWDMTSGARSIYMLPKISQTKKYKKLRSELNIDTNVPLGLNDHWNVFKDIANSGAYKPWKVVNLYFSINWFNSLDDPKWLPFHNYLLKNVRKFLGHMGIFQIWERVFSSILRKRDIRPSLYTNNIVKHLIQISCGLLPGITPQIDENRAPVRVIQEAFTEIYNLQTYIPTIMAPNYFSLENPKNYVYYSLQNPNTLDTPKKKDNSSLISDLYDCKSLLDKYLNDIRTDDLNLENTYFYQFAKKGGIDAFHPDPEKYSIIDSAEKVINKDTRFRKTLYATRNKEIAFFSPLVKGCFRIRSEKQ